jgi:hypothetical protein
MLWNNNYDVQSKSSKCPWRRGEHTATLPVRSGIPGHPPGCNYALQRLCHPRQRSYYLPACRFSSSDAPVNFDKELAVAIFYAKSSSFQI